VAEAKRLFEQEKEVVDDEISALFARAEAAEASGRPGLAKIYYQMIVRRTQGELKRTAQQRLKEL
jgi:hypothetical protein